MDSSSSSEADGPSLAARQQIDRYCDRFETAWKQGSRPAIEAILGEIPAGQRGELLSELLLLDIHYRRGAGEKPLAADYLARFPSLERAWLAEAIAAAGPGAQGRGGQGPAMASVRDQRGRQIYEVFEEIGHGGMGSVLRARDRAFGREVAIKVLLERHADKPEAARRFVEEARISGQLQHPGIAPIYDLGQFDEQRPYFTMKLVKGHTLAALLAERRNAHHDSERGGPTRPRDLPRWLAIFEQVCQTLAYAHAQGVIHRDLKPSNIMVGAFGEVQVMDWGLAKFVASIQPRGALTRRATLDVPGAMKTPAVPADRDTPPLEGSRTSIGRVLGTPAYMAPEQARGDLVDCRADVFGLGAMLCEILTGLPPFVGPPAEAHRQAETACLTAAFDRLDASGAEAELIALAKRCLAAEPIGRPGDAGRVAESLTAHLRSVSERLRQAELARAAAAAKAGEERKRRRVTLAWAATIVLAVTLGSVGWFSIEHDRAIRRAKQDQEVNDALTRAAGLSERANASQGENLALWVQAREQAQRAQALVENGDVETALAAQVRQLVAQLADEERDRRLLVALEEVNLAQAEPDLLHGRFARDRAVPLIRQALAMDGLTAGQGEAAVVAAQIHQRKTTVREAIVSALDDWIRISQATQFNIDEPHLTWLREVLHQADPNAWRRKMRATDDVADQVGRQEALAALARSMPLEQPGRVRMALADRLISLQEYATAAAVLYQAQRRFPDDFFVNEILSLVLLELVPPGAEEAVRYATAAVALRPHSAGALVNLGVALGQHGRRDEQIAAYRRAIELSPQYALAHLNLGVALQLQGAFDEALEELDRAIELLPDVPQALDARGTVLVKLERYEQAIDAYRRAILLMPDCDKYDNLGMALARLGRFDEAIEAFDRAVEIDPNRALAHSHRGVALMVKGRLDDALEAHRRALERQPQSAEAHVNLGAAFEALGRRAEALDAFRKAIELKPGLDKARFNVGRLLTEEGRLDEAVDALRQATELDANLGAPVWYCLGNAMLARDRADDALAAYERAIEMKPDYAEAHCNRGHVLGMKGAFAEALAAVRLGHELGSKNAAWRYPSSEWVADAQRLAALDAKLASIDAGQVAPADAAERIELAGICLEHKRRYAAAARWFAEAFDAAPGLAAGQRLRAARAASLAAGGQGVDAGGLDEDQRGRLRNQAIAWLRADLTEWTEAVRRDRQQCQAARQALRDWQTANDLAAIRDPAQLGVLPPQEAESCRNLWLDVERLLEQIAGG